jgi:hypothetical protein
MTIKEENELLKTKLWLIIELFEEGAENTYDGCFLEFEEALVILLGLDGASQYWKDRQDEAQKRHEKDCANNRHNWHNSHRHWGQWECGYCGAIKECKVDK